MTYIKKTNFTVINILFPMMEIPCHFPLSHGFALNLVNLREIGLRVKAF